MENWLAQLFGPGSAQAAGAYGAPGMSQTMMYPFTTPEAQAFPPPPAIPEGVAGGTLPQAPAPAAYAAEQATGGNRAAPSGPAQQSNKLVDALRGVKAPEPPQAQRVITPHPVPVKQVQGGEFAALMASLGLGPRDVFQLPKLGGPPR